MRRFKYICGGDDGRRAVGSLMTGGRGVLMVGSRSFASWGPCASIEAEYGGGSLSMLSASLFTFVLGGGAPLTIWSSVWFAILRVWFTVRGVLL